MNYIQKFTKFVVKTKQNNTPGLFFCKSEDSSNIKKLLNAQGWVIVSINENDKPSEQGMAWLKKSALYPAHTFDLVKLDRTNW